MLLNLIDYCRDICEILIGYIPRVTHELKLVNAGYIKSDKVLVKLLNGIEETKFKISVQLDAYSQSAKESIKAAGGEVL